MRRHQYYVILSLFLLFLSGCASLDSLNQPRDVAFYEQKAKQAQAALDEANKVSAMLKAQLDSLSKVFADTNDQRVKAGIADLQDGLSKVNSTIPLLMAGVDAANAAVVDAKAEGRGKVSILTLLLTAGVPYLLPLLKGIPGVGVALEPIAEVAWHAYASKRQKAEDESKTTVVVAPTVTDKT